LKEITGHDPKTAVLGLSSDGAVFCSLETKHDKRLVPKLDLFLPAKRLQEQRPQPQKICCSDRGFYSTETKHDKRTASRPI
jgi:hypothetical protein